MSAWIAAALLFFAYVAATSLLMPGLPARRRVQAVAGAAGGALVCALANALPPEQPIRQWILPPSLLLLGYWVSGLLFVAPMPRAERALEGFDRALSIDAVAAATPRWQAELLEAAYVGVYPLIPLALVIHLWTSDHPRPDHFWTVILVSDFICFGFLPWVQTRPPRAFRSADPWKATIRTFSLKLLGSTSIQVNTFPSGHAAEALAAALLVADAPAPLAISMGINAVLISAGAVLGRYHYAADILAGWMVAASVWLAVR
jgi:membrane-associated phospholipid phosphatase